MSARERIDIQSLLRDGQGDPVKMCAPMVRYSKYNCDVTFTPMIVSDSFIKSQKARDTDFTTSPDDTPLVVQFAASDAVQFGDAAELVAPYCDAVDLNCGCPQRWAMAEGYGAHLIKHPDLLSDMVVQAKRRSGLPVSVKLRIHDNLKRTVDLVKQVEHAGAAWITVHGRTTQQRTEPVSLEAIKLIKDSVGIPVVANGDILNMSDVKQVCEVTGVNGVMCARGLLNNPALYAGFTHTPLQCIREWVDLGITYGVNFTYFHHHLMYMTEHLLRRSDRLVFNTLSSTPAVLDFLYQYNLLPQNDV
jgi:tRNA-dihydrouridine synthase 4